MGTEKTVCMYVCMNERHTLTHACNVCLYIYATYRFNVYVSQPEVKPGCVLRRSNTAILEKKGIISQTEAASCKRNMNRYVHSHTQSTFTCECDEERACVDDFVASIEDLDNTGPA